MKKLIAISLFLVAALAYADNCSNVPAPVVLPWNGLEATPAMGWNSYYVDAGSPTETELKAQADLLVSTGLKASGYTRLGLDVGWAGGRSGGTIFPYAANFPDGMAATIAYAHADGLTFGIYSSPYTSTCAPTTTGSGTYEYADAATFASWGADYLKYDGCSVAALYTSCWSTQSHQVWQLMAQALRASGRSIALEMGTNQPVVGSGYDMNTDIQWGDSVGYNEVYFTTTNLYGSGGAGWATLTGTYIPLARGLYKYVHKGYFPDCDMLIGSTANSAFGTTFFTTTQSQTQMGLYALWACPLIIGTDISTITAPLMTVWKNAGVIAVDQDSAAQAGVLYKQFACGGTNNCQIWVRPLHDGSFAMGLLNIDGTNSHTIAIDLSNFGGNPDVQDLWAGTDLGTMSSYTTTVASNGIAMLKVIPPAGAEHTITNTQLENAAIH